MTGWLPDEADLRLLDAEASNLRIDQHFAGVTQMLADIDGPVPEQPLPEWERELLEADDEPAGDDEWVRPESRGDRWLRRIYKADVVLVLVAFVWWAVRA